MKNLYRFNEFLLEGKSIGDFTEDFMAKMEGIKKVAEEAAKKKEEEEKDPTFEFKDKPLKKDDTRKEWVKKIQDVFVHKKIQEKIGSSAYGSFGDKTLAAVKKYQKEKGKEETGEVNQELMKLILKDLEDIEKEKKSSDTPFKNKEEGNAFREWVHNKDKEYADEIGLKKDSEKYNSEIIQKAWKKYGEEYQKDKDKDKK